MSFWYGARSRQEIFYQDYFDGMAARFPNFRFHLALSEPLPEDNWTGDRGFIHEVVLEQYLKSHENLRAVEFYLCGPPQMIAACRKMLGGLGVADRTRLPTTNSNHAPLSQGRLNLGPAWERQDFK